MKTLKQFIKQFDATRKGSIAVGDSDSDTPMLGSVEQPIAFNPNKTLFRHAEEQGWKIVLERKNVVYEMESKSGSYVLAQTNA